MGAVGGTVPDHGEPLSVIAEFRCPIDPRKLFMRLRSSGARIDPASNTIEVACRACRRHYGATLVVHRFNPLGVLVETVVDGVAAGR